MPRARAARAADHPHGRGEDRRASAGLDGPGGSPPRAWGGPGRAGWCRSLLRITPTGVGRTRRRVSAPRPPPDHPHGRGEDVTVRISTPRPTGSPPRAWGGRGSGPARRPPLRITPTGVGRTWPELRIRGRRMDHPHGRGEDGQARPLGGAAVGSPPRAWGGLEPGGHRHNLERITPTGVGRTSSPATPSPGRPDHPHGRGEDDRPVSARDVGVGSPPRAWGGRVPTPATPDARRITPTGVGRTGWLAAVAWPSSDHPHGRGEDCEPPEWESTVNGSPPRAWGGRTVHGYRCPE